MTSKRAFPRRRLLAGALALPVAATAAIAPAVAAADPDAELLELGRQHEASRTRYAALDERCVKALEASCALSPAPDAIRIRVTDHPFADAGPNGCFAGDIMDGRDVHRWHINEGMACILWPPQRREELVARRAEVLAAWEEWRVAREAAAVASGLRALEKRLDEEGQAQTDLEHRILAMRATTPAGWRLKAKIARQVLDEEPDGTYEDMVVRSLLADLTAEPEQGL